MFRNTHRSYFTSGDTPYALDTEEVKLHPFGCDMIIISQRKKMQNAMEDTATKAPYLFSGTYNFFSHCDRLSTSPQTHVALDHATGKLQVTAKCIFPYLKSAEFQETISTPAPEDPAPAPPLEDNDSLFAPSAPGRQAVHRPSSADTQQIIAPARVL